jgi:hypothetical protein
MLDPRIDYAQMLAADYRRDAERQRRHAGAIRVRRLPKRRPDARRAR